MADEVLAIGVSLLANVGGDKQLTFQTAFAVDMSTEAKNQLLDHLCDLADRQKAKAERPEVLKELLKHRETLAQYREDMGRLETNFPAEEAARKVTLETLLKDRDRTRKDKFTELTAMLDTLNERRDAEYKAGEAEWFKSQRGGSYKPRGNRETNLNRMDKGIEEAKDAIKNAMVEFEVEYDAAIEAAENASTVAAAERNQALQNLWISETRYEQAITNLETRLEEIDKLLGG